MTEDIISIIIPIHNGANTIERTLDSLISQTYKNWECIIIDDNSNDGSFSECQKFTKENQRITISKRESPKSGASVCRNQGLNESKGEFVIFLDADDYLLPHCLDARMKEIIKKPKLDFWVFPTLVKHFGTEKLEYFNHNPQRKDHLKAFIRHNVPWTIMGPIWKKTSILKIKGFDENFMRFQDPEIHTKAILSGLKYHFYEDLNYADNVYVVNQKIIDRPKPFKILILNSCIQYINTFYPIAIENNRFDLKSDFYILLSSFLKRFYFYSDINSNEFNLNNLNGIQFNIKERFILKIQYFLKDNGLLNLKIFRFISYKLWLI